MKLLDEVYMAIEPKDNGIIYVAPAKDPASVWRYLIALELFGPTREVLRKRGFRVKKVKVYLP